MTQAWTVAVAVTLAGHGALATWLARREPAPHVVVKRVTKFHVLPPAPRAVPKVEPVPPPEPPPPPPPPKLIKRARPAAEMPQPVPDSGPTRTDLIEPAASGLAAADSAPAGAMAVQQGGGIEGAMQEGHGASREPAKPTPPAPPPRPARKFVPIFEVTRMPRALAQVQPEVPEEFREARREAVVVVEVAIGANGVVLDARVVKKAGFGLDEAATAAARKTRFAPALVGDRPVAVKMQIPFRFKVRG